MAPFIAIIIILAACHLLYIEGMCTVDMKIALFDATSFNGKRSRFSSCKGYMKRVLRVKEDRAYHFSLELELKKGDFWIELLDSNKDTLLRLDRNTPCGSVELSSGKRYRLVFHFRSASGRYILDWE